jgi:hypothetical protein
LVGTETTGRPDNVVKRFTEMVRTLRRERREMGWRMLLRKHGWSLVLLVVAFYLIRDLVLYVAIPLVVVMGLSR